MDRQSRWFRMTAWLAATSISTAALSAAAPPARAQDAAGQDASAPALAGGDPPSRVGRLARLSGTVSTRGAGAADWTQAVLNFPVVPGQAIWTQPGAQADIEVGSGLITLGDQTELDLTTLDDHTVGVTQSQGALFVDLRDVQPGENYIVSTPRGDVQIGTDGSYEILAGDSATPTRVVVVRGAAKLTAGSLVLRAGEGQMAVARGDGADVQGDTEQVPNYDPFLTAMLSRNSVPVQAPEAVEGMTGAEGLAQYGSWQPSPQYGQVWYPQVAADWVPYRDGSWSYVAPWGWTWVDDEPWGFAPFHYGRWAQLENRWCWVPGERSVGYERPVYAPALVDFVVAGAVAGAAAGLLYASLRSGRGNVGWVPLGPNEGYRPPYGGSARYLQRLNQGHNWGAPVWNGNRSDHNVTIVNNINNSHNVFINQRALTVVSAAAMVHSQPIRRVAQGYDSPAARGFQQAAAVQSLRGPLPMQPVAQTRGLTPQVARHFGLGGPAVPHAPGPAPQPGLRPGAVPGLRVNPHAATPNPYHAPAPRPYGSPAMPVARPPQAAFGGRPAQHGPTPRFNGPVMHAAPPPAPRPYAPQPAMRPAAPYRPMEERPVLQRPVPQRQMEQRIAPQRAPEPRPAPRGAAEHEPGRRPPG